MDKVITAIEAQKRNRQRLNISLDGEYAFSLDRLTAAWLKPGRKLTADEIKQLQEQDELESAHTRALHFLSFRSRSIQEVRDYLMRKGCSPEHISAVLCRLEEESFLDDARFSREWLENRSAFRPRGVSLIKAELRQKGVSNEVIETSLAQADLQESELALKAAQRVVGRYAALPQETFRLRLGAFLQRRGFSFAVASSTVRRLWNESQNSRDGQDII
ncbi:MAG TPA: RecX family transcriptional regulator [Anaerolineaceae bacterium]|jgi:regulatory protein|nr:RecX family transcriptional regulator [Anaerolineaceae bacterium]HOA21697.1 RecX family transcriptional regulator [Anaerolineaceae bacterium]HOG77723.1 RecX family transcriptional regulator [Anaerolineaceae bacterium]